jgi:hypothetical protein
LSSPQPPPFWMHAHTGGWMRVGETSPTTQHGRGKCNSVA